MKTSFMDLLNSAPAYSVKRGNEGAPVVRQIYAAVAEIAMWSDPDVESRIRYMDVNEQVSFERRLPFGGVEIFYVTRVQ